MAVDELEVSCTDVAAAEGLPVGYVDGHVEDSTSEPSPCVSGSWKVTEFA